MTTDHQSLLGACVRFPEHVVHRTFVAETVVLNLNTGLYHGLNPMGGHMLEAINGAPSVRAAAQIVAEEYGQDPATVEADLAAFCADLLERGLVEIVDNSAAD
ncbi:MAG TPA: PqqD family protein [Solirubrobacteraceae bacterium]|nr:PqqD family protein [Solirubrobacteraceae bacterium]